MFGSILYLGAAFVTCGTTQVYNHTTEWTAHDLAIYESVKNGGCQRQYKDEAPCLIQFTKVRENTYHAICGEGASSAKSARKDRSVWKFNRRSGGWDFDALATSQTASTAQLGDRAAKGQTIIGIEAVRGASR